jgi:hypothetical protein
MPKFKVGDQVEAIGLFIPSFMKQGTVTLVTPNEDDSLTEYEVTFGDHAVGGFDDTQLRLVKPAHGTPQVDL